MRSPWIWSAVFIAFVVPVPAAAQQAPSEGVLIVSYQKCERVDEMNEWFRANAAPIFNDLVDEGRLVGWGILNHAWGDEWNNVAYYVAPDLSTFHAAYGEAFRRIGETDPDMMARFESHCTEHKDNIYSIVMTDQSTR